MKNIGFFLSENYPFLVVKFSLYLNRRVFVMLFTYSYSSDCKIEAIKRKANKTMVC